MHEVGIYAEVNGISMCLPDAHLRPAFGSFFLSVKVL